MATYTEPKPAIADLSADLERILHAMELVEGTQFMDGVEQKKILDLLESEGGRIAVKRARMEAVSHE